jgi:hypothetical protein
MQEGRPPDLNRCCYVQGEEFPEGHLLYGIKTFVARGEQIIGENTRTSDTSDDEGEVSGESWRNRERKSNVNKDSQKNIFFCHALTGHLAPVASALLGQDDPLICCADVQDSEQNRHEISRAAQIFMQTQEVCEIEQNRNKSQSRKNTDQVEEVVPPAQNESKTTFPYTAAQKQIVELNVMLTRQDEYLAAITIPENPNQKSEIETIPGQLQRAQQTVDALKQIRATHVRIKNCLVHDLPKQPSEAVCLGYRNRVYEIDLKIRKINDNIAQILSLIYTLQSDRPKTPTVPGIVMGKSEPESYQKRMRSSSPCIPDLDVTRGRGNQIEARFRPPLPANEEEDALETSCIKTQGTETVNAVEKSRNVFLGSVTTTGDDENEGESEFVQYDSGFEDVPETPQAILAKITDFCENMGKDPLDVEQSEIKADFEETMEAFHAFVLSENLELKNISVQTEGWTQTLESCADPENASSTIEG